MAENNRLPAAPILVVNRDTVLGGERASHVFLPFY